MPKVYLGKKAPAWLKKNVKRSVDAKQNKKIKKLQNNQKKLMKGFEKKFFDQNVQTTISTTASIIPLNNPLVYSGGNPVYANGRVGQSINMLSCKLRGIIEVPSTGLSTDYLNRVRIMVVLNPKSTFPGITDVLQLQDIDSHYKINPTHYYKVMYDRTFNLQNFLQQAPAGGPQGNSTESFRKNIRINLGSKKFGKSGQKCTWREADGNNTAPRMGCLSLIVLSDSSAPTHPTIDVISRVRFLDN